MNNKSWKNVSLTIINSITKEYDNYIEQSKNPYIKYLIRLSNNDVISIYTNNTLLIQSSDWQKYAIKFNLPYNNTVNSQKKEQSMIESFNDISVIGCDEVGVGDFFGPLVVCCALVPKDFAKSEPTVFSKIKDSKKLTDNDIYRIYPLLLDNIKHSFYIMDNQEYNDLYDKYQNTHKLKAIAHNKCLNQFLEDAEINYDKIIMDQFVNKEKYFSYLEDQNTKIIKNIEFYTKAEDKVIAVACASIIARYHFLTAIETLSKKYNINLPLGAGNSVKTLVNNYKTSLPTNIKNFIKLHFNDKIK